MQEAPNLGAQAVRTDAGVQENAVQLNLPGCRPNPARDSACAVACPELCNGIDDDCDGQIDEDALTLCPLAHAEAVCRAGVCLIARCQDGYRDCDEVTDNGCEVLQGDPRHCGSCGHACRFEHARAICRADDCERVACDPGFDDCDGDGESCETRLDSRDHCGSCEKHCSGECLSGVCSEQLCDDASPDQADCDGDRGCETDLTSDRTHCGSCEHECTFTVESPHGVLSCDVGECHVECDAGRGDCDGDYQNGCEQTLNVAAHCGSCDTSCDAPNADAQCMTEQDKSRCRFASCLQNWDDCDGVSENGCERDVRGVAQGGDGPCLPDSSCKTVHFRNHEYYICEGAHSWMVSRAFCRSQRRGDLAHVPDAETMAFLKSHVTGLVWIGASDSDHTGLWVWTNDGTPFWQVPVSGKGQAVRGRYVPPWDAGEPDDTGNCGAYSSAGLEDHNCADLLPFICETGQDECPDDPKKDSPGQCGCKQPDTDADKNGLAECSSGK